MEQLKTVLVVDDEEMIEEIIQAVVESFGCRTTSFTSPREALQFLVDNIDRVMLMITDLKMPALPGPELIRQALKADPKLPVIAVSGHADEYQLDGIRESIQRIVAKPFTKSEIIEAVESALFEAGLHCSSP